MQVLLLLLLLFLRPPLPELAAGEFPSQRPPTPIHGYRILQAYPHDPGAFTQGLVIADGILYEGTGLNGRSSLRRVDLATGTVLQSRLLPAHYFGEGIAVLGERIFQLTWRSGVGLVYDRASFALRQTLSYPAEGWGLTTDGTHLIASDGSASLRFLDPETFTEVRRLAVTDQGRPVARLNELEYVAGQILANVWQTERIAIIEPASGRVSGWLDLSGLLSDEERGRGVDVLNGIAFDSRSGRLYVTGKLWPRLFAIEPVPPLPQPGAVGRP